MNAVSLALSKAIRRGSWFRTRLSSTRTLLSGSTLSEYRLDSGSFIKDLDIENTGGLRSAWRSLIGGIIVGCFAFRQVETVAFCDQGSKSGSDTFFILPLKMRQRQFFKYEKRLRENSSADKVFEYFANLTGSQGEPVMSEEDVMRSFCPVYPPVGSDIIRSGSLPGEDMDGVDNSGQLSTSVRMPSSALAEIMKIDGQDGISLHEWLLLDALVSFPIHDIHVLFRMIDTDGNGEIDAEELLQLFVGLQKRLSLDQMEPEYCQRNLMEGALRSSGLIKCFLANDRNRQDGMKGSITLEVLEKFCQSLRDDILSLEFTYYSQGTGCMNGENLAISLVSCADIQEVDQYLDSVHNMPEELKRAVFNFEDYKKISEAISDIRDLTSAALFYVKVFGPIDRKAFGTIVHQIKKDTCQMSEKSLDILFYLFRDTNGMLLVDDMYRVLKHHFQNRTFWGNTTHAPVQQSFFTCCLHCLRDSTRHDGFMAQDYKR